MEKQKFTPPICPECEEEEVFSEGHGTYVCMCYLLGKRKTVLGDANAGNTQREERSSL